MYTVVLLLSMVFVLVVFFFFQAEDGIRDLVRSRGLGDVYKRQLQAELQALGLDPAALEGLLALLEARGR